MCSHFTFNLMSIYVIHSVDFNNKFGYDTRWWRAHELYRFEMANGECLRFYLKKSSLFLKLSSSHPRRTKCMIIGKFYLSSNYYRFKLQVFQVITYWEMISVEIYISKLKKLIPIHFRACWRKCAECSN